MCAKKGEKILECIYVPKDKQLTLKIAEEIGVKIPFDDISPFAAYGTMFWFRPKARDFCLEKLYLILVTLLSWTVQE